MVYIQFHLRKGVSTTGDLAENLLEELNCKTAFTIPVFGGLPISESVVVTWLIMAILTILSICLVRNLKVTDVGRKQLVLEMGIGFLYQFFDGILGKRGRRYVPYLITVALYVGVANLIGLFGFKPPTKDLNVTVALSLMSILLIEYSGFHEKGLKKWLKSFAEPIPIIAPINILEIFIRPVPLMGTHHRRKGRHLRPPQEQFFRSGIAEQRSISSDIAVTQPAAAHPCA